MLKALYDFQAVYPKTISFVEGEYFILYQTSARQRNWWQVVSMKGNIGFVPSNYVMKIKVEADFLISFLNSSIESLEKCPEAEINDIMPKEELLDRLREKKNAMEKLYLENSDGLDGDSSLSFSHSLGGGERQTKTNSSASQQAALNNNNSSSCSSMHPLPSNANVAAKRLDSSRKSLSSPLVGVAKPPVIQESPSLGSMQVQTQQSQQQQQQDHQKKSSDIAQDNSIASEPSETTTTTTTTSEEVVTTYKEAPSLSHKNHNGSGSCASRSRSGSGAGASGRARSRSRSRALDADGENGDCIEPAADGEQGDDEMPSEEKTADKSEGSETPSCGQENGRYHRRKGDGGENANDDDDDDDDDDDVGACRAGNVVGQNGGTLGGDDFPNSVENSQALDSEDSGAAVRREERVTAELLKEKVASSDVYQIVDVIRRNTNLSFDLSCEALRVVLTSLEQLYNGAINPYLEAVAVHVTERVSTPKALLGMTHDAKRLQYIFAQLADCKNDSEQRTWMLYEDEDDIVQFLEELVEILNNADENITCYEMSCDQYQVLINLVQYYQMETRWPIKRLLLQTFSAACHLDHIIVDILLTSVLPLEIVEDMKTNFSNLDRFKQLVKMLTIVFSLGQPMPVNHQDFLGVQFVSFLLEIVEGSNPEVLVDLIIALILAFNLQFTDFSQNVVIEAVQGMNGTKVLTEKILLMLNREEDPIKLLKHSSETLNSVLKMFIDIFSNPETAGIFYTNDNKVLIDILVRQLTDLCAGNPLRRCYLELCRRILRNTNYQEHQHRKQDLMKIFTRIFCEETECSAGDQQLVRDIANEFPQLFKA